MKKINWNIGVIIIRVGYLIRKFQLEPFYPPKFSIRWEVGKIVLRFGYFVRGKTPQRTWRVESSIKVNRLNNKTKSRLWEK